MTDEAKITKLNELKELGVISEKQYKKALKKINQPPVPEPSHEPFSWKKLVKGMFSILDPVEWAQTLRELGITDVRKWVIYALIIGCIYGWGYVKGIGNKPVHFDMRGKEAHIALNAHYLHITPDGSARVEDKDGKVLKNISVKDIPGLRKALKPIGIDVEPFFTAGGGIGMTTKNGESKADTGLEAGVGTSFFKIYKIHLDTWLTNRGIYLGADYALTENFGLISGIGKGYKGDNRMYFGGKWKF